VPGPLDGFRVVDLSQIVSGPFASMLLSDQGAAVVKVEPVVGQDVTRRLNYARGGLSAFYLNGNRGKRSISVDLTRKEGCQVALRTSAPLSRTSSTCRSAATGQMAPIVAVQCSTRLSRA